MESRDLSMYLYTNVYSSIIHNNQKVEAIQVSSDDWRKKTNHDIYTQWSIIQF